MRKYKNPLSRNLFIGCIALVFVLSTVITLIGFYIFRKGMYVQYESHLGDVVKLVESYVDLEDIDACLETNTESEKFSSFVHFVDRIQASYSLDSIILSRPFIKDGKYDIIFITSGYVERQRRGEQISAFPPLNLGDMMAKYFPPGVVERIYKDFEVGHGMKFNETPYSTGKEKGVSYSVAHTVFDSNGNPSVLISAGMPITFIHVVMRQYLLGITITAIIVCAIVLSFIILWLKNRILSPLNSIEVAARALEEKCRTEKDPEKIIFSIPKLESGDEFESMAETLTNMSEIVRNFIRDAIKSAVKVDSLERNLDETQQKAEQLELLAIKDSLTGIRNKTAYDEEVKKIIWEIENGNNEFGVAMIDLNYLKRINDTFGHEKGNISIIKLCQLVCAIFSHSPVFRIGGDEFVVILRNRDYKNVDSLVRQFNFELEEIAGNEELEPWEKISGAIGYAKFDKESDSSYDNVFRRADKAMYERKKEMKAMRE